MVHEERGISGRVVQISVGIASDHVVASTVQTEVSSDYVLHHVLEGFDVMVIEDE
jgi:hypothetical protein